MKIRVLLLTLLTFLAAGVGFAPYTLASGQLQLASGSAMVVDMQTHRALYAHNPNKVVLIASLTKLMTAVVTLDAHFAAG